MQADFGCVVPLLNIEEQRVWSTTSLLTTVQRPQSNLVIHSRRRGRHGLPASQPFTLPM